MELKCKMEDWVRAKAKLVHSVDAQDESQINDILSHLGSLPLTLEILQATKIGVNVNKLKKHSSTEISSLARSLILKWKSAAVATSPRISAGKRKCREKKVDYNDEKIIQTRDSASESKGSKNVKGPHATELDERQSLPKRNKAGELVFRDYPDFRPNLTPKEVLQAGSFGGTYFRPIKSSVTGLSYRNQHIEFPKDWFDGLDLKTQVCSPKYFASVNKYKKKCGGDLDMWEGSGWISDLDPYGWFQWYCRFYLGRRSTDDERQIARGLGVFGAKGRFRNNLIGKISRGGATTDDVAISPVIRQSLQHWGYRLTLADAQKYVKLKGLPAIRCDDA